MKKSNLYEKMEKELIKENIEALSLIRYGRINGTKMIRLNELSIMIKFLKI